MFFIHINNIYCMRKPPSAHATWICKIHLIDTNTVIAFSKRQEALHLWAPAWAQPPALLFRFMFISVFKFSIKSRANQCMFIDFPYPKQLHVRKCVETANSELRSMIWCDAMHYHMAKQRVWCKINVRNINASGTCSSNLNTVNPHLSSYRFRSIHALIQILLC